MKKDKEDLEKVIRNKHIVLEFNKRVLYNLMLQEKDSHKVDFEPSEEQTNEQNLENQMNCKEIVTRL